MTPKRLNLSLRNLTPPQVEALDNIRRRTGRKTYASAIVKALEDWDHLRAEAQRHRDELHTVRDALGSILRAHRNAETAAFSMAEALRHARAIHDRTPVDPRQLTIPA